MNAYDALVKRLRAVMPDESTIDLDEHARRIAATILVALSRRKREAMRFVRR